MSEPLSASAQKVQAALDALGFTLQVVQLPQTTRTAAEAAQAVGCAVGQIAKSLIFRTKRTHKPIMVIASGANRVNEKKIGELVGEPIEKPDADFVREKTGFVIGGVPPLGHAEKPDVFVDEDLLQYAEIWAAAGNPNAVFKLTTADLVKMSDGRVAAVKQGDR